MSKVAHKNGKALLSFTAQNNLNSNKLPLNFKLKLWGHTHRLHVEQKYGLNYGGNLLLRGHGFC